jgi:hypothetical protein
VPPRFRGFLTGTNTVHIVYDDVDELLPYDEVTGRVDGIGGFYRVKGIAAGDRIHIQLKAIDPTYLRLTRSW